MVRRSRAATDGKRSVQECAIEMDHEARRIRRAAEIGFRAPNVAVASRDGPGVGKVIVGGELREAGAVGEIDVDEAGQIEIGRESVRPLGAQEDRMPPDRFLLVGPVGPDEPEAGAAAALPPASNQRRQSRREKPASL